MDLVLLELICHSTSDYKLFCCL